MAKKKVLKINGYTNLSLKIGNLFSDSIIEPVEIMINDNVLNYCDPKRYECCKKENECDHARPRCHVDRLSMVGKSYVGDLTDKDRDKIDKLLASAVKSCRPIVITVELNNA